MSHFHSVYYINYLSEQYDGLTDPHPANLFCFCHVDDHSHQDNCAVDMKFPELFYRKRIAY